MGRVIELDSGSEGGEAMPIVDGEEMGVRLDREPTGRPGRWTFKAVLLTYRGHLNKETYMADMEAQGVPSPIDLYIAHEVGATGYEHTHVYARWSKTIQNKPNDYFDLEGVHPNIARVNLREKYAATRVIAYLSKQDTTVRNLASEVGVENSKISFEDKLRDILQAPTFVDAVLAGGSLSAVQAVKTVWDRRAKFPIPPRLDELRGWQNDLAYELDEAREAQIVSLRKIVWYCDAEGGAGKTMFCKWYKGQVGNVDDVIYLPGLGGKADVAHYLTQQRNDGNSLKVFLVDITRTGATMSNVYELLERILDGCMFSSKYGSDVLDFEPKALVVFANEEPDRTKLSADRWDVRYLGEKPVPKGDPWRLPLPSSSDVKF